MKSARGLEHKKALEIQNRTVPKPKGSVLVNEISAKVCHIRDIDLANCR
jgi:hypothetical protein